MTILAGGVRAVLSERGPHSTFHLALVLDAPSDRLGALLERLEANCEVYRDREGRWCAWDSNPSDPEACWARLGTLRAAGADPATVGRYKAATFAIRYARSRWTPPDPESASWPASCQDCPYSDGQAMCQCV